VDVHVRVARSVVLLDLLDELVGITSEYELVLELVGAAAVDELLAARALRTGAAGACSSPDSA